MNSYKKILVPVDFSDPCKAACDRAKELAEHSDVKIIMLHIIDYILPNYASAELPQELVTRKTLMKKAKEQLEAWASKLGLESSEQIINIGKPKSEIAKMIECSHCDLVILAPHTDNAFARFFGSVTNSVAQNSDCDVLIVRKEI